MNHEFRVTLKAPNRPGQNVLLSAGRNDSRRLNVAAETTIAATKQGVEVSHCASDGTAIATDGRRYFLHEGELCEEYNEYSDD
jgi:hypothetical protein